MGNPNNVPWYELKNQLSDAEYGALNRFAADGEASDAYAIALSPTLTAYATGQRFVFTANTANTGAATLNVDSLGAKTIKKLHDQDLETGDIESGQVVEVVYDGTNMQLVSGIAQVPAGGGTVQGTSATYDIRALDEGTITGNARGENTVDLQTTRIYATEVASATGSAITGGRNNTSSGVDSFVGGGISNVASGDKSTIAGGYDNEASGEESFVGGGDNNRARGTDSTVGGGYSNYVTTSANFSTIAGGSTNTVGQLYSTVGGGRSNNCSGGSYGTIAGGQSNTASAYQATVGGGNDNNAQSQYGTVGGGAGNYVQAGYGTIAGGLSNFVQGTYGAVGGGYSGLAIGPYSFIAGGYGNTTTADSSYAVASGRGANATRHAERVHSSGVGQLSECVSHIITTDATPTETFLDGNSKRLTIASKEVMGVWIRALGVQTATAGGGAVGNVWLYEGKGVIKNISGTTSLAAAITLTAIYEDDAAADIAVAADDTNDALKFTVTGIANCTIRWNIYVDAIDRWW